MGMEIPKPEDDENKIFITNPQIGEIRVPEKHMDYGAEGLRRDISIDHSKKTKEILDNPSEAAINDHIEVLQSDIDEISKHPLNAENDAIFKKEAEKAIASLEEARGLLFKKAA